MSHLPADFHRKLEGGKTMLSLADVQVLAATAERNGTSHAFVQVALQWCAQANAEVERLRVDAARYRWLRAQHWWEGGPLAVVARPKDAVKLGRDCPSGHRLDDAIDDAMQQAGG